MPIFKRARACLDCINFRILKHTCRCAHHDNIKIPLPAFIYCDNYDDRPAFSSEYIDHVLNKLNEDYRYGDI